MIQLLGGLPEPMAQSAARAAALGAPGIDLNFGCPAKTVNRHDGGAALLKDPARVYNVVKAVRAAVPQAIPVSAKMRLGFADKSLFLEIALAAEEAGAQWLAVHARTRDEGYRPPAHWDYIARICEALRIPTIANGEIWTSDDYDRCRGVTGCAAIMLGRGLIAAPDLALRAKTPSIDPLAWPAALSLLLKFTLLSQEARAPLANSERYAVCRCKQWLKQLGRSYPEAIALFAQIKALESFATLIATLTHLLQELPQEGPQELPQELLQKEAHAKSAHLFQVPLSLLRCRQKPADAKGRRI
jgi:tRNA-dihydrouridine synthase C